MSQGQTRWTEYKMIPVWDICDCILFVPCLRLISMALQPQVHGTWYKFLAEIKSNMFKRLLELFKKLTTRMDVVIFSKISNVRKQSLNLLFSFDNNNNMCCIYSKQSWTQKIESVTHYSSITCYSLPTTVICYTCLFRLLFHFTSPNWWLCPFPSKCRRHMCTSVWLSPNKRS